MTGVSSSPSSSQAVLTEGFSTIEMYNRVVATERELSIEKGKRKEAVLYLVSTYVLTSFCYFMFLLVFVFPLTRVSGIYCLHLRIDLPLLLLVTVIP